MNLSHVAQTLGILLDMALRRLRGISRASPVRRLPEDVRAALGGLIDAAQTTLIASHSRAVTSLLTGTSDARACFDRFVQDVDTAFASLPSQLSCDVKLRPRVERVVIAAIDALARDLWRAK